MPPGARSCGECRLCCKVMAIPDLGKPADVWCVHAGDHPGGGCGIYQTRPAPCREFLCSWLSDDKGFFREEDRPDRIGVVFWVKENGGTDAAGRSIPVFVASERHAGAALQNAQARAIIEGLRRRGVAVSIRCGETMRPVQLTREGRIVLGEPPAG